jgi:hypothetical protein
MKCPKCKVNPLFVDTYYLSDGGLCNDMVCICGNRILGDIKPAMTLEPIPKAVDTSSLCVGCGCKPVSDDSRTRLCLGCLTHALGRLNNPGYKLPFRATKIKGNLGRRLRSMGC